ncbi:MAG: helix-turn-helix transcriptional regulator, partial [Dehalococcoidia bacterium]
AEIVPEVRAKLPDLESPPTLDPEEARFRLFDSIVIFLRNVAQSQPLMLVLDDLHWADKPSLLLLQFLARQMGESRLLIVGSYRDAELSRQHPLSETLAQLTREPVFRRESLRGLSQEEAERFVASTAGIEPSRGLVETIYAQTEGNPFFMSEVIRLLSEQGELTAEGFGGTRGIRIPEGVREVIGQRLNRLSEHCNQVLTTAAIIGREFEFELLSSLRSEITEEQLLDATEEAVGAQLIEETPGKLERYQFSHVLIQETLAEEVSAPRRVRLHARIAEALEDLYGTDAEAHASELAYHFSQAEPVLGIGKLVHYALLAGEQALAAYAWEEGLAHFQRGLAAKEGQQMDAEMAALLFGLGRAQLAARHMQSLEQSVDNLIRAFDYYVELGKVDEAVEVAEYPVPGTAAHYEAITRLPTRALDLVPPDSHQAGRLLVRHAWNLGLSQNNYSVAQEALDQALVIAERENDSALQLRALVIAGELDNSHCQWSKALERNQKAIELARQLNDPFGELRAYHHAASAMMAMGALEPAHRNSTVIRELAERLDDSFLLATALSHDQTWFRLIGDWQAARSVSDYGLTLDNWEVRLTCTRVLVEYETGNLQQGREYLWRLLEPAMLRRPGLRHGYAFTAMVIGLVGHISGEVEKLDAAKEIATTIVSAPAARPFIAVLARAALGMLVVLQQDKPAAAEHYSVLLPKRGTMLTPICPMAADRLLGLLASTVGDYQKAEASFVEGMELCQRNGMRPEYAWTCHDYADALLKRVGPGDQEKADSLLEELLDIATELGMHPLKDRVQTLQERLQLQPVRVPAYPDGLTQREVEVLRLVAAGKTDREIADDLFIGVRTVSSHVSNILNKINALNRVEAATYATRQGLV